VKGTLRLVRVFGIDVGVHWSFLLLIAWVVYQSASMRSGASMAVIGLSALVAVVFVLSIFGCVVLHELGHALTARVFGIQTRHITILPIGGVAALERIPTRPLQELLITIAGPAVNIVIAAVLVAVVLLLGDIEVATGLFSTRSSGFFSRLAFVNIALAVFNMLPAFPMDGGRVLRALLAIKLDYALATRIAAVCGRVMAMGFVIWGLAGGGPFLLLIAVFVFMAGKAEVNAATQRSALIAHTVGAAMHTRFNVFGPDATLNEVARAMLEGTQRDFPIVDGDGRLVGLLGRQRIVERMGTGGPAMPSARDARVEELIDRALPTLAESDTLADAIELLRAHSPALVVERHGQLVGLLTQEGLAEFLMRSRGFGPV
jgi:Zn-dependent protease/CBS domain-containing protein